VDENAAAACSAHGRLDRMYFFLPAPGRTLSAVRAAAEGQAELQQVSPGAPMALEKKHRLTVPFLPVDPGPLKRLSITLWSVASGLFKKLGAFSATGLKTRFWCLAWV